MHPYRRGTGAGRDLEGDRRGGMDEVVVAIVVHGRDVRRVRAVDDTAQSHLVQQEPAVVVEGFGLHEEASYAAR